MSLRFAPALCIAALAALPSCDENLARRCAAPRLLAGWRDVPGNVTLAFTVDTCTGDPVVGLGVDDFVVSEDGRPVPPVEGSRALLNPQVDFRRHALLLLDLGGGIATSDMVSLQGAARAFVDALTSDAEAEARQFVAIYGFDGAPAMHMIADFTNERDALRAAVDLLSDWIPRDLSTNLYGAVVDGIDILDGVVAPPTGPGAIAVGAMVLFTDGIDRAGYRTSRHARAAVAGTTHAVLTIGLGGRIDPRELSALGPDGFEHSEDAAGLAQAFARAAGGVRARSDRYYVFGYCSPSRVGLRRMTLSVRGYDGSFDYEFGSTGFGGVCDPCDPVGGCPAP